MSKYTVTKPLLLRQVVADRVGESRRLINPVVELTGAEAKPMLAAGQVIPADEDKGKPEALPIEQRKYVSVVELPDDIAKRLLRRGTIILYQEPVAKKATKKAPAKSAKSEEAK